MRRRLTIAAVVVLLIVGTVAVLWHVLDWPPPGLILKYGFPPAGGPTGRTKTIAGMEFVEVAPGYLRVVVLVQASEERSRDRRLRDLGFRLLDLDLRDIDEWVEQPRSLWISRHGVPDTLVRDLCPSDALRQGGLALCESFASEVSVREPGTFRLPYYREFYFALEASALGDEATWEVIDPRGSPTRSMGLGGRWSSGRFWSSVYPPIPSFRLIWIPPEE